MTPRDRIKPDIELKEVLKLPRAKEVLARYSFACFKCGGIGKEKLIHAAQCHGIDVEVLIREILDGASPRE